jgi:HSA
MSSTRNTKRKRQQQKDEGGGGGSSAAASTSRRRSRDQRAQASSSKTSDPDLEDEASQSVQDSSQDVITTSQTPPTADVSMEDVPGAEVERDPTKQPPQEDYKKTPAKDTKAQSSPTADPPNGTSVHDNLPQNESKSELMTQHARSLRSSPIPVDDAGGNSSQVGTDGQQQQRLPLHISTTLVPEDRETRIQDLIAHRTLLLERVRACRESAEKRLGETKLSSALPRPPAGEKGKEELTDKEEMAAFYDMTKKANQNLKRPKTEGETASDKRTSFSLRRGSGVGKKMNAALSSLAPGSSAAAAAAAAAATVSGSNIEPTIPAASVVNPVPPKTAPSSGGLSPKFGGTTPPPKFPSNQQSAFNPSTTTTDSAFRGRGPGSKAPRTGAGVIPGVHAHPSSFSRPGEADPSTKTTGPGGPLPSAPHLSPNRINQAQSQVPRVFFPEAAALREKRDIIREKLRALLERQHQHQQDHPSPIRRVASREDDGRRSLTASPGRSSAQSPQQHSRIHRRRRVTGVEIQPPTTLPDRRRTHWDTVMQEMSWLAADFIQERQWKVSSARVISSEVPQHHLLKRRSTATLELESRINHSVINEIDGKRSTTAAKCKQERKGEDVDDEMEDGTDNSVQKKTSKKAPYKKPSLDDETRSKVNGKVVSTMISEVNIAIQKGGASEDADTYHKEGLHRFRKARLECRKAAGISSESDTNSSDTTSEKMVVEGATNGKTSEEEETTLESISERIEQLHKIGKSRHKSTAREYANALMSKHKINLHSNQKSMVDFVEKLWGGEPSAGAVLSGPATSGKTYATATIIWKQRSNGPQIVVCSPQSLVSRRIPFSHFSLGFFFSLPFSSVSLEA